MSTATISKDFHFSASHQLDGLPEGHQCGRLHGHNYVVRIELTGEVVAPGFVVDYGQLAPFGQYLDDELDHRHLNDRIEGNPTAERMAALFTRRLAHLLQAGGHSNVTRVAVSVSETPKTWARVELPLDTNPLQDDADRYRWGQK